MKCSDLQLNLFLDSDFSFERQESVTIKDHLASCPLCRQKVSEYQEIRSTLRKLRRPDISSALIDSLKSSVRSEMRLVKGRQAVIPMSSDIRNWMRMRVMPIGVGVFTSLFVAVSFLTMMFSGMLQPVPDTRSAVRGDSSVMLASNSNPFVDYDPSAIMAVDFARSRLAFSDESPSINPQGALIALTKSLIRGGMKDEEVVVVAEVFSNGLARITEVVEPSHDKHAIKELEKALQSDPAYAPFVPSLMEGRPENMKVILRIQSVNVNTSGKTAIRR